MNISYGKEEKTIEQIKGLQKVIGLEEVNRFGVKTEEELNEKLSEMQLIDLQRLAISVGIPGGGNRMVLKRKIMDAFNKFLRGSSGTAISFHSDMKLKGKNKKERQEEIKELLKV